MQHKEKSWLKQMKMLYGKAEIPLALPAGVPCEQLHCKEHKPLADPEKAIREALHNPISSPPLQEIVKIGERVCILINDTTRVARTELFLPLILAELNGAGIPDGDIFAVVANGSHRLLTGAELQEVAGLEAASRIAIYNHDCRDSSQLVHCGQTSFGTPIEVNRKVFEAERRILTGSVVHHFFAGFGGGRKALIPGVAGLETIRRNHSLLLDERACGGRLMGNPVHDDLLEGALMVGADFLLNTVLNEEKEVLGVFAGEMIMAHEAACQLVDQVNGLELKSLADVVIASCGGYPKDINVYQAHKTLDNALRAMKPGGELILIAECPEGVGSAAYEEWINRYQTLPELEKAIRKEFVLGGHKAYAVARILQKGRVYLLSSLAPELAKKLGFIPVQTLEEAVSQVYRENSNLFTYLMPKGANLVPFYSGPA